MFRNVKHSRMAAAAMLVCALFVLGCRMETEMPLNEHNEAGISYSIELPSDLPKGSEAYGKFGGTSWWSSEDIVRGYSSCHRKGWNMCLGDLNHKWDLERGSIPHLQGYEWLDRGFTDGYRLCLERAKAIQELSGEQQAKLAVRKAVEALPVRR